jgi:hypothetical protein
MGRGRRCGPSPHSQQNNSIFRSIPQGLSRADPCKKQQIPDEIPRPSQEQFRGLARQIRDWPPMILEKDERLRHRHLSGETTMAFLTEEHPPRPASRLGMKTSACASTGGPAVIIPMIGPALVAVECLSECEAYHGTARVFAANSRNHAQVPQWDLPSVS